MIDSKTLFANAYEDISNSTLEVWMKQLPQDIEHVFKNYTHGELDGWQTLLAELINVSATDLELSDKVSVGNDQSLSTEQREQLIRQLKQLHPWRKGPYHVHGIHIDTEWRSDWKWQRILPEISPLKDRTILDVGCGNGYHLFRMRGEGAKLAIGIDPSQKFLAQFLAMKHFFGQLPIHLLPLGIEQMPKMPLFDTVFSMGVLYHRRSPIDHIQQLKELLRPGGELVLETLVVEGDINTSLLPKGRYAQMRNVWFLPSTDALTHWMQRCGLNNVKLVDCTKTSIEEQRATQWMHFHSLENYLDPNDNRLTIEGYPAPMRATIVATV